jgi:nicotinamidase/pyrazinamidase
MPSIAYDDHSVLLVVDLQEDFASPNGSLYVPDGDDVLNVINPQILAAREAGALIVFTQDWHPPDTPHFKKDGGVWPVHCVRDTPGAELVAGIERDDGDEIIRKGVGGEDGYSAFSVRDPETGAIGDTGLDALLKRRGIERVVIVGLATDYCVKESGLDSVRLGYETSVLMEGVRAVDLEPGDGDNALVALREAGVRLV